MNDSHQESISHHEAHVLRGPVEDRGSGLETGVGNVQAAIAYLAATGQFVDLSQEPAPSMADQFSAQYANTLATAPPASQGVHQQSARDAVRAAFTDPPEEEILDPRLGYASFNEREAPVGTTIADLNAVTKQKEAYQGPEEVFAQLGVPAAAPPVAPPAPPQRLFVDEIGQEGPSAALQQERYAHDLAQAMGTGQADTNPEEMEAIRREIQAIHDANALQNAHRVRNAARSSHLYPRLPQ